MPKAARDVPPPLELLCLNALWAVGEGNVKDVQHIVAQSRPLAYTTIMTVLDRLVRKGRLARRKVGRAFVYTPQSTRDAMRQVAVRELLEGFFDGSQAQLVEFLRGTDGQAAVAAAGAGAGEPVAAERIDTVLL